MKEITITMTPSNANYPTVVEKTTDIRKAIYAIYHDSYDIRITSDWYETVLQPLLVDAEKLVNVQLKTKKGTLKVEGIDAFATVGIEKQPFPASFSLSYADVPYQVRLEKKFHEPLTEAIAINPITPHATLAPTFVRKASVWKKEIVSTERLRFDTRIVVDHTKPSEYKTIDVIGVDGVKTFYIEKEYIENEATGETRNTTSLVTTEPIMEVITVGKKDNLPRNPNITSSGELLKLDNVTEGVLPTVDLRKEDTEFYESFTYGVGGQTAFNLNKQDLTKDKAYLFSVEMRFPTGTNLAPFEAFVQPDVKRVLPKPVADGKWHRVHIRYVQQTENISRSLVFGWTAPPGVTFDARRAKLEEETENNTLYGFPLPYKLKEGNAKIVKKAIGKVPTPW